MFLPVGVVPGLGGVVLCVRPQQVNHHLGGFVTVNLMQHFMYNVTESRFCQKVFKYVNQYEVKNYQLFLG